MSTFLPGWASCGPCFHVKPKSSPNPSNSRANPAPSVPPPSIFRSQRWVVRGCCPIQWSVLRTADRGPSPVPFAVHPLPRCLQLTPSLSLSSFQNPHVSFLMYNKVFSSLLCTVLICVSDLLIKCGKVPACTSGWASQVGLVVKKPIGNAKRHRFSPWVERIP